MNSMIALLRSTTKYGEVKITAWRRLLLVAYLAPNINTLMERLDFQLVFLLGESLFDRQKVRQLSGP